MSHTYFNSKNVRILKGVHLNFLLNATFIGFFLLPTTYLLAALFEAKAQVKEYCVSPSNIVYLPPSQIQQVNNIMGQSQALSVGEETALNNLLLALKYWFEETHPMQEFEGGLFLNFCGPRAVTIKLTDAQYEQAKDLFEETGANFHEVLETNAGTLDLKFRESLLAAATLQKGNTILDDIARKALSALLNNSPSIFDQPEFLNPVADFDRWWNKKIQIHPEVLIAPSYFSLRHDTIFGGGMLREFQFLKSVQKKFNRIIDFNLAQGVRTELLQMRSSIPVKVLMAMRGGDRPMENLIEESHLKHNFVESTSGEILQYLSKIKAMSSSLYSVSEFQNESYLWNASTFEVVAQLLLMQISQFEKQGATKFELADALEVSLPLIRGLLLDYSKDQPLLGPRMHELYEKIASLREHTIYGYLVLKLAMFNSIDRNNNPRNQNPYSANQEDNLLFARLLETKVYTDIETKKPHVHYGSTFSTLVVLGIEVSKQLRFMNSWLGYSRLEKSAKTTQLLKDFQSGKMVRSHQNVIDKIDSARAMYAEQMLNADIQQSNSCILFLQAPKKSW